MEDYSEKYTIWSPLELVEATLDGFEAEDGPADQLAERIKICGIEIAGIQADFRAIATQPERFSPETVNEFKQRLEVVEKRFSVIGKGQAPAL